MTLYYIKKLDMNFVILLIIFTAGISLILNILFKKVNIHSIIGYILTGSIISYIFQFQNEHSVTLDLVAEFGIAFLMFSIGLEFSINKLKSLKKEVFWYGSLQVLFTTLVFYFITQFAFHIPNIPALIISLALALSSTAIVLKLLNDSRKIYKTYGKNAVGVLLFQDLAVIPILVMISVLANTQNIISDLILNVFMSAFLLLTIFFVAGRYFLPHFLNFVASAKSDEIFITSVLLLVIGSAQMAHMFGFSYSLGTFIAGMIISKTQYKFQIEADLIPFRDLLLGIFFISVGMQLNLAFIPHNLAKIILILGGVILIKSLIIFAIIHLAYRVKTSLKTAIILAQVGEFSFVIFELAKINGLFVDTQKTQIIMIVIIFSMILTPFIFNNLNEISDWFVHEKDDEEDLPEKHIITNHIIVCGYGGLGQKIVKKLKALNIPYLAVDRDRKLIKKGVEEKDVVIFGNAAKKSLLEQLNIHKAKAIIIAMSNDKDIHIVGQAIKNTVPKTTILASATNLYQKKELEDMKIDYIVNEMEITADAFLNYLIEEKN